MNYPTHFNVQWQLHILANQMLDELIHFTSEAIIVTKHSYSIAMAEWNFIAILALQLASA